MVEGLFELILQFLLITVIGGAVYALMSVLKEEQTIQQIKVSAVQDFGRELRELYREIKLVKRRLRSRIRRQGSAWRASESDFRDSMDELLEAQIQAEALKDDLSQLEGLIDAARIYRLKKLIRYPARYLHDVYEDFERGRVKDDEQAFVVDAQSPGILSFIAMAADDEGEDDVDAGESTPDASGAMTRMEAGRSSPEERFQAFEELRNQRPRQARIAYECFRLASVELRAATQDLTITPALRHRSQRRPRAKLAKVKSAGATEQTT